MPAHKERSNAFQRQCGRNSQDVIFVNHDLSGIAAEGRRFAVLLVAIVGGAHALFTILFLAGFALRTFPARIDKAPDADQVIGLEFGDLTTRFDHAPNNFVPWHHGVDRASPFVAGLMDIGMADATVEDVDLHIVGLDVPALEAEWSKRIRGALDSIGVCVIHK